MSTMRRALLVVGVGALVYASAALPSAAEVSTDRVGGLDRYATSVVISQRTFPEGVGTVFLGSGEDYPDALVAGAAGGAYGYPVLLTERDSIPDVVRQELDRLAPATIVILGGEAAVSARLEEMAGREWGAVTRLGGADRYETAVLVSEWAFNRGLSVAYLASGADFPDALSGGVAGALADGPVLLTNPDSLSPATADHLADLGPGRIVILGGSEAISDAVATAAGRIAPVSRIAGADRFATSAAVSAATFTDAATVVLANGMDFPDALAGTPLAAALGAPILLVEGDSVSEEVCGEVRRLGPENVMALGGTAAVSDSVLNHVRANCVLPDLPGPKPGPTYTIEPPPSPMGLDR